MDTGLMEGAATPRERWEALPEDTPAELIDGRIVMLAPGDGRHVVAASVLGNELLGPFQRGVGGPGGWWILDEAEVQFGEAILHTQSRRLEAGSASTTCRTAADRDT